MKFSLVGVVRYEYQGWSSYACIRIELEMKSLGVEIKRVFRFPPSQGQWVGPTEDGDRRLYLCLVVSPENPQVGGVPVTPGQRLPVCPLHHPETLLGAPVVRPGGVRDSNAPLCEELTSAQPGDLLVGPAKHGGPEHSVGQISLPPDVLLGVVEEEREIVVPGQESLEIL